MHPASQFQSNRPFLLSPVRRAGQFFFGVAEKKLFIRLLTILSVLAICTLFLTADYRAAMASEVKFTEEFMENTENLATGKKIWLKQCSRCHGMRAYPGKAPKLNPSKYKIDFVYKRVTKGFRGMPRWTKKYDKKERMSVSAYVMSPDFEN